MAIGVLLCALVEGLSGVPERFLRFATIRNQICFGVSNINDFH